jgi:uncharacterized membrane protein YkvA (DUF1232 family)
MSDSPEDYTDQSFWDKLKKFALQAGKDVVEKALTLYYAAQRPETPLWAKTVIYSALAYFVLPTDAIPDVTPIAGYADDLGALAAALTTVAMSITPEVRKNAKQKMQDWFERSDEDDNDDGGNARSASDQIREIAIE